jgi:hypothetical protein
MSRTRALALLGLLALLPGCAAWIEMRSPAWPAYDAGGRPASSYYCYDCHGYRYFDPYYDWCVGYGFRYAWARHPEAISAYRERYVRIKEQNPTFGRYRYRSGYRAARGYRQPRDYDSWRAGQGPTGPADRGQTRVREKSRREPGSNGKKDQDRNGRELRPSGPRDARPSGR